MSRNNRYADPTTLTNRIVKACSGPRGLDLPEIQQQVEANASTVYAIVRILIVKQARLHRAGSRKLFRYFAHEQHARNYSAAFEQERERVKAAKVRRKLDKANAKSAAQRRSAGIAPRNGTGAQPRPKTKTKHGPALTIGKSKAKAEAPLSIAHATTVTWPAHVQVQRAPTPRDDRFAFTPPPGWKGELASEWDQRRKTAC
jgi:hypothetical protein